MKGLVRTLIAGIITFSMVGVTPIFAQKLQIEQKPKLWVTLQKYEETTGEKIERFNEAPVLRTKVAAGILPSVGGRLPEEPLVVKPLEEIGQYGGTLNAVATAPMTWEDPAQMRSRHIADYTLDLSEIVPVVFKGWEYSKDKKSLTVYLRKGMRWSDGAPFTTKDVLFWYEDILRNKELTPIIGDMFKPGGELMKMEVVDDYTFRLHFAVPNPRFHYRFAACIAYPWSFGIYAPKHYLKKWHIKYNPEADELAKGEGYDHWWQAFHFHGISMTHQQDPNLPTLHPWVLKKRTPTLEIFERNPYYWMVDTAGNQLPYIDELVSNVAGDVETANLKVISGEIDLVGMGLSLQNYPLYKENEKKGNYRVLLWQNTNSTEASLAFNLNHKNPVLRKIFQDVRFRRAMSLAINRDEISEVVYRGRAVPRQETALPTCSFYKEEWDKAYAQYDPEKANALLDEIGLKWDEDHKWRLRPDGKTLAVTIEYWAGETPKTPIMELVKEYWEAIGVKTDIKSEERSFYEQRAQAGELDVGVWHGGRNTEVTLYTGNGYIFNPASGGWEWGYCRQWGLWFTTDGKEGEEPPEEVKELYKWFKDWFVAPTQQEYTQLAQKIFDFHAKNIWMIGTVGLAKQPIIAKNNLRNIPGQAYFGCGNEFWLPTQPPTWCFKK